MSWELLWDQLRYDIFVVCWGVTSDAKNKLIGLKSHYSPNLRNENDTLLKKILLNSILWTCGELPPRKDSIMSKCTDTNTKCQHFHTVNGRNKDGWGSCVGDVEIIERLLIEFQSRSTAFNYMNCWVRMKDRLKWGLATQVNSQNYRPLIWSKHCLWLIQKLRGLMLETLT